MHLKFVTGDEMRNHLDMLGLIESLRASHLDEPPIMQRVLLNEAGGIDTAQKDFLAWNAWQHGKAIVVKMVTLFPDNVRLPSPVPSVQALIAVFDAVNGSPLALLDGTELTYWKTAADSALGASYLAPANAQSMLMIGAGAVAPYLIKAYRVIRPSLQRVMIWNRSLQNAESLARSPFIDGPAEVVSDVEAAVGQADIVCCATSSSQPIVQGAWLREGTHVDLIGGYTPDMREADDRAVARAQIFVDSRWFTIEHCGDLLQPIQAGVIKASDVQADLYDLCQGRHRGRRSGREITLFKSGGGAHLDLMAALHAMQVIS